MKRLVWYLTILFVIAAVRLTDLSACDRLGPVVPEDIVATADLIVRATAVGYSRAPARPEIRTTGTPDSVVHFRIEAIVKGRKSPSDIDLPGYLSTADDFNEQTVPYKFVRAGGRAGSCFANTYRQGAEFLLMLKFVEGAYTISWYALGPTNEQLHSAEDPWLKWVRTQTHFETTLPN
jgi:hypothetical protein